MCAHCPSSRRHQVQDFICLPAASWKPGNCVRKQPAVPFLPRSLSENCSTWQNQLPVYIEWIEQVVGSMHIFSNLWQEKNAKEITWAAAMIISFPVCCAPHQIPNFVISLCKWFGPGPSLVSLWPYIRLLETLACSFFSHCPGLTLERVKQLCLFCLGVISYMGPIWREFITINVCYCWTA